MSRICVKNIGKSTSEKQLRELFSSKGEVTDVRVITSKDGKSRRFAFVGFRTDVQANEAQNHFNNTFIGMSRISVELAKKFNDKVLQDAKQKIASKKSKAPPVEASDEDKQKQPNAQRHAPATLPKRANMLSSSSGTVEGGRFFTSSVVVLRAPALLLLCADSSASRSTPCCAK
jgi:RNA recognition motif-containing protein